MSAGAPPRQRRSAADGCRLYAAYFTGKPDPQRGERVASDDFGYLAAWHRSVDRLGLEAVILHDGLSPSFVERHATERIRFEKAAPTAWSTNDARFLAYREHLARHPARRVFLTDISDVVVVREPFSTLAALGVRLALGDEVYPAPIGHTIGCHAWLRHHIEATRTGVTDEVAEFFSGERLRLPTLNAGVIGGDGAAIAELLDSFVALRERIGAPERNLNMPLINYLVHRDFAGRIHHGAPITSRFKAGEIWRRDVCFVHK
ncbi:MAG TPA: hypothetical protein VMV46_05175 [Thermoanaerobaculia bacterium]|nr:hypothetical protein [Thermoanaerobaculia bacterium]